MICCGPTLCETCWLCPADVLLDGGSASWCVGFMSCSFPLLSAFVFGCLLLEMVVSPLSCSFCLPLDPGDDGGWPWQFRWETCPLKLLGFQFSEAGVRVLWFLRCRIFCSFCPMSCFICFVVAAMRQRVSGWRLFQLLGICNISL
jgi:hypothetical protein